MRRFLPLLLIAVLWLPLLASFWEPEAVSLLENRRLATFPSQPHTWAEVRALPAAIDAWSKDHFGFRTPLLIAHNRLRFGLFGEYPSDELLAGTNGQIFTNPGATENMRLVRHLCGLGVPSGIVADRTTDMTAFLFQMRALNPNSYLLTVPHKSRVYPEKLPGWVQAECATATPPVPAIMATLAETPWLEGSSIYPLAALRAADPPAFPPPNFHWTTSGAQPIAALVAETLFGLKPTTTLPYRPLPGFSDLTSFMPGLTRPITDGLPDFAAADTLACQNQASCFPEFSDAAGRFEHISRFRRNVLLPDAQRRPRLLLISDSFGAALAPGFIPYFAEIWHFSMNGLTERLTPAQREEVRHIALDLFQPDIVLFTLTESTVLWQADYVEAIRRFITGQ